MSAKPRSLSCLGSPEAAAVVDRVDAVLAVGVLAVLAVLAVAERAACVLVVCERLVLEVPSLALVVVPEPAAPPLPAPPPGSALGAPPPPRPPPGERDPRHRADGQQQRGERCDGGPAAPAAVGDRRPRRGSRGPAAARAGGPAARPRCGGRG